MAVEIPRDSQGNVPKWVLYGGAIAGIAGLFVLLRKQQTSGTTAAGTSINAALGSIQEEVLNSQGALSKQAADNAANLQTSIGDVNTNVYQARGDIANYGNAIYGQAAAANTNAQTAAQYGQSNYWATNGVSGQISSLEAVKQQQADMFASVSTGTH